MISGLSLAVELKAIVHGWSLLQEHVGNRVPIIGVGSIHTPDQAIEALEKTGIPLIALGRELIMEPQWVEKVEQGKESRNQNDHSIQMIKHFLPFQIHSGNS